MQPALDSPSEVWIEPHVDPEVDGVNQDTLVPPVPVVPESVDPVPTTSGEMATATPEVSVTPGTTADMPPMPTSPSQETSVSHPAALPPPPRRTVRSRGKPDRFGNFVYY